MTFSLLTTSCTKEPETIYVTNVETVRDTIIVEKKVEVPKIVHKTKYIKQDPDTLFVHDTTYIDTLVPQLKLCNMLREAAEYMAFSPRYVEVSTDGLYVDATVWMDSSIVNVKQEFQIATDVEKVKNGWFKKPSYKVSLKAPDRYIVYPLVNNKFLLRANETHFNINN